MNRYGAYHKPKALVSEANHKAKPLVNEVNIETRFLRKNLVSELMEE